VLARVLPDVDVASVRTYGVPRRARWCDPISWQGNAAGADDKVFIARRGRFRREIDVVPHERVQSARLTQGPLQRKLGLATVHLDTSPGPVHPTAHHRDARDARHLLDAEVTLARRSRAGARPERWMRPSDPHAGPTLPR
jgi:putative membrane protein